MVVACGGCGGLGGMGMGGGRSADSRYQVVKGSEPEGRRTSATQVVAAVRGGRQGYTPLPPFFVGGLFPLPPA
jgi:hypothetical protein